MQFVSESDVINGYRLMFGRDPESALAIRDKQQLDLSGLILALLEAPEFRDKVHDRLVRGETLVGDLFVDRPPTDLIRWVAEALPLSSKGREDVRAASSWYTIYHAIFSDPLFVPSVGSEAIPWAGELVRAVSAVQQRTSGTEIAGSVELVSSTEIKGWAADRLNPTRRLHLALFVDGVFQSTATTGVFRREVQEAVGGDGRVGFVITRPPDESWRDGVRRGEIKEVATETLISAFPLAAPQPASLDEVALMRREIAALRKVVDRIESRLPAFNAAFGFGLLGYPEYFERYYAPMLWSTPSGLAAAPADLDVVVEIAGIGDRELTFLLQSIADQSSSPKSIVLINVDADRTLEIEGIASIWRVKGLPVRLETDSSHTVSRPELFRRVAAICDSSAVLTISGPVVLSPLALEAFVSGLAAATLVYSDEDSVSLNGKGAVEKRHDPKLRSDFDPELALQGLGVGPVVGLSADAFRSVCNESELIGQIGYEALLWKLRSPASGRVAHLPEILVHQISSELEQDEAVEQGDDRDLGALRGHLAQAEPSARIEQHSNLIGPSLTNVARVRRSANIEGRSAAIIIPTRDRPDLLGPCIASLLHRTRSARVSWEIIIVDNQSTAGATKAFLRSFSGSELVRVIVHDGQFNWALMNNRVAELTDADVLVFLNDDTVALSDDWLDELAEQALRPEVGAVGARLLYEDGSIQHAGVVIGGAQSFVAHEGALAPGSELGYLARHALIRSVLAVTGACIATRRNLFLELGGFDEINFPVEASDIDYCFKCSDRGLRVLFDPYVTMYHLESKSRGLNVTREQQNRVSQTMRLLRERWEEAYGADPFYNSHFDRSGAPFSRLAPPPILRSRQPTNIGSTRPINGIGNWD